MEQVDYRKLYLESIAKYALLVEKTIEDTIETFERFDIEPAERSLILSRNVNSIGKLHKIIFDDVVKKTILEPKNNQEILSDEQEILVDEITKFNFVINYSLKHIRKRLETIEPESTEYMDLKRLEDYVNNQLKYRGKYLSQIGEG